MRMVDCIQKKKEGRELTREEWAYIIGGLTDGGIPDYQVSALLMAIYFQGLNREETFLLADAMVASGDIVDLSKLPGMKVDKHSTGGVGDTTSLIVGPLAASCGITVAKMSGRGLGFSGGTIDKLESIPGFRVELSEQEFIRTVERTGMAIIGQTGDIVPADKKLYALRDVTATVDNISLIAASIMSKKIASGGDAIVLDVKCGQGAFMKTEEEARELGQLMVDLGNRAGKTTVALITAMDEPLGRAVGNSLEVLEASRTLQGDGPADMEELCTVIAGHMIWAGRRAETPEEGCAQARQALYDGSAFDVFRAFVREQGGDDQTLVDGAGMKQAKYTVECIARDSGYVYAIKADQIGGVSLHLGAGRATKEDAIDSSAGLVLHKKAGDPVFAGESLATLYTDDFAGLERGREEVLSAFSIRGEIPEEKPLIRAVLT